MKPMKLARSAEEVLASTEAQLVEGQPMTADERSIARDRVRNAMPLIRAVMGLVERQGGRVLGIALDLKRASDALEFSTATKPVIARSTRLANRLHDEALGRLREIADQVLAIYQALGRTQRTPEGQALAAEYEALRALAVKPRRKATSRKSKKTPAEGDKQAPSGGDAKPTATATAEPK